VKRVAVLAVAACHVRAPIPPTSAGTEVTLYRDAAVVREHLELDLAAAATRVSLDVPAGVAELTVVDRGGLAVASIHVPVPAIEGPDAPELATRPPSHAMIDVIAPHAGHYSLAIAYVTDRLTWTAAYSMMTTPARDRATLHGALAVTNATGLALPRVALRLVDAPVAGWRAHARELLAAQLVGDPASTTPIAPPRELGEVALDQGETRVDLPGISAPHAMRSVLVYDPIGTSHDNPGATPVRDVELGVSPPASTQVSESFEIARDAATTAGLPAGPVKLYEDAPSGALALLGQSRLFDDATRVAPVDTIPIGTAAGVTAHRERRDLTIEDDARRHRVTEEFVITVDNARDRPVDVLVREHLYRGQTWLIAYESTNHPEKEGAQQIALRTDVPAKAKAEVTYVVVYSWKP
jgi:hypothetical protein